MRRDEFIKLGDLARFQVHETLGKESVFSTSFFYQLIRDIFVNRPQVLSQIPPDYHHFNTGSIAGSGMFYPFPSLIFALFLWKKVELVSKLEYIYIFIIYIVK